MKSIKLLAVIMAAVICTAVFTACEISVGSNGSDGGGLGDYTVGGSSTPDNTNTPDPTNSSGDSTNSPDPTDSTPTQTNPPDTSTQPPETSKPTDPPSGGGNVVGKWEFLSGDYIYAFNDDGTFSYISTTTTPISTGVKGKYTVSDGKIYLKDIYNSRTNDPVEDLILEYQIGKDAGGDYLLIPQFWYGGGTLNISQAKKFTRF